MNIPMSDSQVGMIVFVGALMSPTIMFVVPPYIFLFTNPQKLLQSFSGLCCMNAGLL